ncbi:hypothetical protein I5907_15730 [Panacibacter sp. DH6]|uniref:Uncharacterized protein n=1 Tax=Panacibacter microcysteis TaxID=2793269 RepID=A0A931E334_9BACT|nr:hypothetical protein [Panacibacter microcysteis]MBG9377692.1 hypothetical protein [Panacibacter microcysteis]
MRTILAVSLFLGFCFNGQGQTGSINMSEYFKPKCDTLFYNCVYNSFHASGLHDTVKLVWRKIPIANETAYYISSADDTTGNYAQLRSFSGSAMIFRNDTILLASLTENQSPTLLTKNDFSHIVTSNLMFSKPFDLAKLKWSFVMEIFIKDFQFEDVTIEKTVLKNCLRLNLLVYDRSTKPDKATVWLSRDYGTVKWIRTTGRTEVLDLTRFRKNCR